MTRTFFVAALVAFVLAPETHAQDNIDRLSERLIELRGTVEDLNEQLDVLKDEHKTEMQSLAAQKAELETNQNRLQTQVKQLEERLAENRKKANEAGAGSEQLEPVLYQAISGLRQHIERGLPFKRQERLSELSEIETKLGNGSIGANRGANRLWAFFEDEIRLTKENGLYSQTVPLGNEDVLADVAKLGMMMLFFKTQDERIGRAVETGSGWNFEIMEGGSDSVVRLFDSLQKQIRQGYFVLPNALPNRGQEVAIADGLRRIIDQRMEEGAIREEPEAEDDAEDEDGENTGEEA